VHIIYSLRTLAKWITDLLQALAPRSEGQIPESLRGLKWRYLFYPAVQIIEKSEEPFRWLFGLVIRMRQTRVDIPDCDSKVPKV
jgi:hypothetical protein